MHFEKTYIHNVPVFLKYAFSWCSLFSLMKAISVNHSTVNHCVKRVHTRSFLVRLFQHLDVSLRIQSECRKIRNRKNPNTDIFHFFGNVPILYCLKTPENQRFSDVFREHRIADLARDGLIFVYFVLTCWRLQLWWLWNSSKYTKRNTKFRHSGSNIVYSHKVQC